MDANVGADEVREVAVPERGAGVVGSVDPRALAQQAEFAAQRHLRQARIRALPGAALHQLGFVPHGVAVLLVTAPLL